MVQTARCTTRQGPVTLPPSPGDPAGAGHAREHGIAAGEFTGILVSMEEQQARSGRTHSHGQDQGSHRHDQHEPALRALTRLPRRLWHRLWHLPRHLFRPHSHDTADRVDAVMEASADGMRALWISLAGLAATAAVEAGVAAVSGSVALLGDTLHNAADALTAVPLGVAFLLGRRPPTRRYTYGYGRAEDLAGIVIVAAIAASAVVSGYAAIERLAHPRNVSDLTAVAVAALAGFTGNELVARYRIRVGRRIGSAALVADGLHARTDGFTSLAVLIGAGATAAGWRQADPVAGLLITVAILATTRQAAREIYRRLMDAVDPALVEQAETTLRATPGVLDAGTVRLRWIGHRLRAECEVLIDPEMSAVQAHQVAVDAEHNLIHALPRLAAALVHADPCPHNDVDLHAALADHR